MGSLRTALFAGLLVLGAPAAAIAEDVVLEQVASEGSQIVPAGASDMQASGRNLNTVPEDGLGPQTGMSANNHLVRKLLAARPDEDLIICVAGCSDNHDRVVYAQPTQKSAAVAPTQATQN
jgi:hypothetical protein